MKAGRSLIPRSLDKRTHRRSFRAWLEANGAAVLDPTNEYEVIRFRGSAGLSIIYKGQKGHSFTGQAQEAWDTFSSASEMDLSPPKFVEPVDPMSDDELLAHAYREPITVAFIMERDVTPMRVAVKRLRGLEHAGRLVRSGGCSGQAFRWGTP